MSIGHKSEKKIRKPKPANLMLCQNPFDATYP